MTDKPFKLTGRTLVIVRDLPVLQCAQCAEQVIEDPIMERVDDLLEKVDPRLELEVVDFSPKECRESHIYEKVVKALQVLFMKDEYLIDNDVHEVTISHKLAEYLQYQFPDMNVDCEYNRQVPPDNGDNIKRRSDTGDRVRPDIIVHKRGSNENNCLVIEIKIERDQTRGDKEKLKDYSNPKSLGYKYGLFLELDRKNKCISKVLCFQNGTEKIIEGSIWEKLKTYDWRI